MTMRHFMNLLETVQNDPLGIVARIRAMDTNLLAKYNKAHPVGRNVMPPSNNSYFHITPCGRCKAPVWQQPCPVCGYYPMGEWDEGMARKSPEWEERASKLREKAHQVFNAKIQHAGNYAAWYFKEHSKIVAFNRPDTFEIYIQPFLDEALAQDWPSADEIWDAYSDNSQVG